MAKPTKGTAGEFAGIPGWSPEMEELYRKRIQETVNAMTTGRFARVIRAAIVNPEFRRELERDPARVLRDHDVQPKGDSVVLVQEDRGEFPIVIPKVLWPDPMPSPDPSPVPDPTPGPRPRPTPGPDPVPGGGFDVGPGELFSGSRAFMNDDFDYQGVRNDAGKHSDGGEDVADVAKASDGSDPTGDPDTRDG